MKTEDSNTTTATASPTIPSGMSSSPYPSSWASNQIPIDPALQQQSQHPPATPYTHYQHYQHYPQATYAASQYQQYMPQAPPQQPAQSTPAPRQAAQSQSNGIDTTDIATLNDALGSAGVDLRAEEETLQRTYDQHQTYRSYEDRTRKQPPKPNFDTHHLSAKMRAISAQQKVPKIPDDAVNYLALSLRARLQDLLTAMIEASAHRTDTQFDRPASTYEDGSPMWSIVVKNDVAKQLAAIEKVEREEETKLRRERKERAEMAAQHANALAQQASGSSGSPSFGGGDGSYDEDSQPKKKKKKDGPGVTARNMSEDVRKKMSNAVASQAAGIGGKYAWMNASAASPGPGKAKPAATPTTTTPAQGANSSWARPYLPTVKSAQAAPVKEVEEDTRRTVTLRDAMFVVEKERGHGGGRGSARGWI